MELVEKAAPINDENNRKKSGYYISDPMSLFYYRYIFRYSSQLNVMNSDIFYQRYIQEDFENAYVPKRFETIGKQYLIRRNRAGLMDEPFEKIGRYYYDIPKERRNGEFDIVTCDPKGYIFYEVKFQDKPLSKVEIEKEIAQVQECGLQCYRYGFLSKSGFEAISRDDVVLISLESLYV